MGLRTRSWFTLLSITAIKTGALLPIVMSEKGKPPLTRNKQTVQKIPSSLYRIVQHVQIPIYRSVPTVEEGEPDVFESIIQTSLERWGMSEGSYSAFTTVRERPKSSPSL